MVAVAFGKMISVTTVRQKLKMYGSYGWVKRFCVSVYVQSRGAGLKWRSQHLNQTVSEWGNVMFTSICVIVMLDESKFDLKFDNKRIWFGR